MTFRPEAMSAAVDLLVFDPTDSIVVEELDRAFRLHHLWQAPDAERLLATVAPAVRGLVVDGGSVDDALLGRFPALEIVASYGVGYDAIDAAAAGRRGIVVTNTPGVLDDEVADLCVGLLLATIRELPQADRYVRAGKWPTGPYRLTSTLRGRTVGIFGLGRIGKAVARRLEAFGVELCYFGRTRQPDVPYEYVPGLVPLAERADTLICAVPGGSGTRHAVNAEVMRALGPDGVLVNIGRGATIDEPALIAALQGGTIRAAGLDVFEDEPDVPEQLMRMENVVLLPHVGTGSFATREAMARLVVGNIVDWFAGRGPRTPVPETSGIGSRLTTATEERL